MTQTGHGAETLQSGVPTGYWERVFAYDRWMQSVGIPIHKGYYIEDLRTLPLGWWADRGYSAGFIQLSGQEGVSEAHVCEIPAGESLPPLKFALDEVVYVVEGRGLTTVWSGDGPRRTFEWQKQSLFLLPHNQHHQISNMQGDRPVRLLRYSYLPVAMSTIEEPSFFLNNAHDGRVVPSVQGDFYSEARAIQASVTGMPGIRVFWYGSFFPDMGAWDKLDPNRSRGAGGHSVFIQFPASEMSCHMSVFPARTYKKAHRHGPGRVIVIPAGEGYSILWEEGREKIVVPWHEASVFVPPNRWFHQHFNVGGAPARYLALHPLKQFSGHSERVEDRARDQIEYADEEPWIREKFESELAKRGLTSIIPAEAYQRRDYEWAYKE